MSMISNILNQMRDPVWRSLIQNNCLLRSYQSDALRNIFDAAMSGRGERFAVMFPRQSGKNETQAQLEAALMAANQHRGGNIIKIIPTEKNQGKISTERLASVLSGTRGRLLPEPSPKQYCQREGNGSLTSAGVRRSGFGNSGDGSGVTVPVKRKKDEITYGNTAVRCLSASPNAAIVGATAELLLEVDEAQMVAAEKYDREAAPMAAANNAVQVF